MEIKEELLDLEDIKRSKKPLVDLFIRRTAVITQTSENLVDLVIRDQWRNMLKVASGDSPVSELDVPMIGLLKLSKNKANKKIAQFSRKIEFKKQDILDNNNNKEKLETHIQKYEQLINNIKNKLK